MRLFVLIFILFFSGKIYSQQAAEYFPEEIGYKWNYELTILDSLNNPIPELIFSRIDSSAFVGEYNGKNAYHILTKTGIEELIQFLPYSDTNYVHLSGTDGYEYRRVSELEFILSLADSSTLNILLPFIRLFESFNGWYLSYKFAADVNQQYLIAFIDTTITYESNEIPVRFVLNGKRLQDEELITGIGNFLCRKFILSNSINYLIILPDPLPPIVIPIVTMQDTVWIAPDNWIVKNILPSTNIDLTFANLGEFTIPGMKREILSGPTGIKENTGEEITFKLEQNYPNPFNPTTKIKFSIVNSGYVKLKVYDLLGREVVNLIEEKLKQGEHEITFNSDNLSSGIYFYKLEFSDINSEFTYMETKKMSIIK